MHCLPLHCLFLPGRTALPVLSESWPDVHLIECACRLATLALLWFAYAQLGGASVLPTLLTQPVAAAQDVYGKWYFVHAANQGTGLLLAIAAAIISLSQSTPIPRRCSCLASWAVWLSAAACWDPCWPASACTFPSICKLILS